MRDEAAKWNLMVNQTMGKYADTVRNTLKENAGRGADMPDGETLGLIVDLAHETKKNLTEGNAKIYKEARERILSLLELLNKLRLAAAKLRLKEYQEHWLNDMAIDQAEFEAQVEKNRNDVKRLEAEIDARTEALIRLKADIDHELNLLKIQLTEVEKISLGKEIELVNAKVATAQERLKMIDYLRAVVDSDRLVIEAEQLKAEALTRVVDAKERVVEVKRGMIPDYVRKADARNQLAEATIREAADREALEMLGYEKTEVERAKYDGRHDIAAFRLSNELPTRRSITTLEQLVEETRLRNRIGLQDAMNETKRKILEAKRQLEEDMARFKIDIQAARREIDVEAIKKQMSLEAGSIASGAHGAAGAAQAGGQAAANIMEGAATQTKTLTYNQDHTTTSTITSTANIQRNISK